jgi:NADH-quinone oxidoreductase subunit A
VDRVTLAQVLFGVLVAALLSAGLATAMVLLGSWLGPRGRRTPVMEEPFECGNPSEGAPAGRIPVPFYRMAILFVVFDVEIAFFYPWAVRYRDYGWAGFWTMLVFAGVLFLGFGYLWKRGALEWD